MQIDFKCSGGFANLQLTYLADTDELPQELAQELLRLVESSVFFEIQPEEVALRTSGPPDVFFYSISLSDGSRQKFLAFNDVTAPASLQPLLARLRRLAIAQRRQRK